MRYGHAMTAWTGIFHWLNNHNFDKGEKDFQKVAMLYRQILIDFMLFKGMKIKLHHSRYKGKKIKPHMIDANTCAFQVQKVFNEFTVWAKNNPELNQYTNHIL